MSPRGKEKRHHDRVSDRLTLRTLTPDLDTIEMETANLSLGGAYCLSSRSIPPMTKLRLNIFLPSTDGRPAHLHYPIEVDAVVVRAEQLNANQANGAYRLALFFSNMEDKDRHELARYLRSVAQH
jgi:c-di-GMP-binding flagellar brake protein YcgR